MRRRMVVPLIFAMLLLIAPIGRSAVAQAPQPPDPPFVGQDAAPVVPAGDTDQAAVVAVMVQLAAPLGKATTAAQRRTQAQDAQQQLIPQLEARGAQVLFRTQALYSGVAVTIPAGQIANLRGLAGVSDVEIIQPKSQVEAQIPSLIASSLAQVAPPSSDGAGVRVGVIDSGIDYTHADFGGPGSVEAYNQLNRTAIVPGSFPTAVVVDGYDFAGETYDAAGKVGSVAPTPDPNPIDCNGRGTHIAGLIAGRGVAADGTMFNGPYVQHADYSTFRVPPGIAPAASLVALKVFGCNPAAETALTTQALEWAVDPNRDGDTSDHLDAVIIALSTPFGSANDADALAVERASSLGVTVITAAGDGRGSFYSVAAFGSATQAISVGASVGSPQPINASDEAYSDPACYNPGDLAARFTADGASEIVNHSATCSYQVGMASYRKFDELIDHQQLLDAQATTIAPGATLPISVKLPDCAVQVDVFRGPVLRSLNGRRYAQRLLTAVHLGGTHYCAPESAPTYGLPESAARGIQRGNGALKPDLVAPGINLRSAGMATGTGSTQQSASWVAAAQVAGAVALLRGQHRDWQPAQIKATLMNTAAPVLLDTNALYPPSLAGAGQLDISRLMITDGSAAGIGDVAVSYGAPQVSQNWSASRTLRVANWANYPRHFTLRAVVAASENGVELSLPPSVDVPAFGVADVAVSMTINPAALDFSPDQATPRKQDTFDRYYLAEVGGYIQVRTADQPPLSVPFVAWPRANSEGRAINGSLAIASTASSFALPLQNSGARSASAIGSGPNPQVALASAFELLGSGPLNPTIPNYQRAANLRYVGITSDLSAPKRADANVLFIGLATYAPWSTPNEQQFRILVDTNADGIADYALINVARPTAQRATDAFIFELYKLNAAGSIGAAAGYGLWNTLSSFSLSPYVDVAPFNSSVVVAALGVDALNLAKGQTQIGLRVESRARDVGGFTKVVDQLPATGWMSYDIARPAIAPLSGVGLFLGRPLFIDATGSQVTGIADTQLLAARGGAQLLLLHHHNTPATQAEVVTVRVAAVSGAAAAESPSGSAGQKLYLPIATSP